jgi:hypothetical protein
MEWRCGSSGRASALSGATLDGQSIQLQKEVPKGQGDVSVSWKIKSGRLQLFGVGRGEHTDLIAGQIVLRGIDISSLGNLPTLDYLKRKI